MVLSAMLAEMAWLTLGSQPRTGFGSLSVRAKHVVYRAVSTFVGEEYNFELNLLYVGTVPGFGCIGLVGGRNQQPQAMM